MPGDGVKMSSAASVLMLEREAEVAALESMLDAARAGEGRLVVVEGTAGIGKTRLLGAARELAYAAELEVLTARGGELEGEFAFGVVRQLFEAPLAAAAPGAPRRVAGGCRRAEFVAVRVDSGGHVARRGGVVVRDDARPLLGRGQLCSPPTHAVGRRRCALGGSALAALASLPRTPARRIAAAAPGWDTTTGAGRRTFACRRVALRPVRGRHPTRQPGPGVGCCARARPFG